MTPNTPKSGQVANIRGLRFTRRKLARSPINMTFGNPNNDLVERIYEAAALPDLWPSVLQEIADQAGAVGATMIAQDQRHVAITASPRIEPIVNEYIAEGWAADPEYAAPLLADKYPGFRAETHYRTIEEIERLPVHAEFLAPRGLVASVGTVLQGARDDMLHMALEGMPSHEEAEAAAPWLDGLRGPLARAMSLTARLRDAKAANAVAALELAGVGAAVVSGDGRLRSLNDRFEKRLGKYLRDRRGYPLFVDDFLQRQVMGAVAGSAGNARVSSVALPTHDALPPCAVHLLPLRAGARDVFGWDGVLLMLAEAANAFVPDADLLRLLFDLTPAEARLARWLMSGASIEESANQLTISKLTARTQLRSIFSKTGVSRQVDLVLLLAGLRPAPED